jgi:hypothetical protein
MKINIHITKKIFFIILLTTLINTNKINVWLDCDPGLDDTFAIILQEKIKTFT